MTRVRILVFLISFFPVLASAQSLRALGGWAGAFRGLADGLQNYTHYLEQQELQRRQMEFQMEQDRRRFEHERQLLQERRESDRQRAGSPPVEPRQQFNGQGTQSFANGAKYVGEFRDNKFHGQGTSTSASGEKYVGEFRDNKFHGQGTYTFANGAKYVGEFRDNKFHGQGTSTSASGGMYVGEFRDNKFHGQGTSTLPSGEKYVGEFRDGKPNGQGTFTFADGAKYVGEFRDGKYNGQGTYTRADGRKYVGEWRDGKPNGQGTLTLADGRKYVGEFKDDKFNGQGQEYRADGSLLRSGNWESWVFVGSTKVPPQATQPSTPVEQGRQNLTDQTVATISASSEKPKPSANIVEPIGTVIEVNTNYGFLVIKQATPFASYATISTRIGGKRIGLVLEKRSNGKFSATTKDPADLTASLLNATVYRE